MLSRQPWGLADQIPDIHVPDGHAACLVEIGGKSGADSGLASIETASNAGLSCAHKALESIGVAYGLRRDRASPIEHLKLAAASSDAEGPVAHPLSSGASKNFLRLVL